MVQNELTKGSEQEGGMLRRMFTSLLVLLISYLLVIIIHHLLMALMGKGLGYTVKLCFAGIDMSPKLNRYWGSAKVIALFAMPSLVMVLVAVVIFVFLQNKFKENSLPRYFFFWLMLWCFLWPFSQLLAAPFSMVSFDNNLNYQGLAVVANWFGIPPLIMGVSGALGIGVVVSFGFMNGGYFLRYIHSLKGEGMRKFWLQSMFYLPVLISIPVSILFTYPVISIPFLSLSSLALFFGAGMSLYVKYRKANRVDKGLDTTYRSSVDLLIVLLLLGIYARFFMTL